MCLVHIKDVTTNPCYMYKVFPVNIDGEPEFLYWSTMRPVRFNGVVDLASYALVAAYSYTVENEEKVVRGYHGFFDLPTARNYINRIRRVRTFVNYNSFMVVKFTVPSDAKCQEGEIKLSQDVLSAFTATYLINPVIVSQVSFD